MLASAHKRYHARLVDKRAAIEQSSNEMGWWWLSFVDPEKPDGQGFLGVAIVEGYGVASATTRAHELGVNPGVAVQGMQLKSENVPEPSLRDRLLSRDELTAAELI